MKALLFIETDREKILGGSLELISSVKALDAEGTALIVGNRAAADTVADLGIPVIFIDMEVFQRRRLVQMQVLQRKK